MTMAVVLGLVAGVGCIGLFHGLRAAPPSLEALAHLASQPPRVRTSPATRVALTTRIGAVACDRAAEAGAFRHPLWQQAATALAITNGSREQLASQVFISASAGALGPPVLWLLAEVGGVKLPLLTVVCLAMLTVPLSLCLPILELRAEATRRRRHFRAVLASCVDLVVLSLAGGIGIEGALIAATSVTSDWASARMARALLLARDTGDSPWTALGNVGVELGVPELTELSATLCLAGTEGARIRQSLSARAVSLRRHEQAEAESAANSMTERLFLPGAVLLLGFLLFVGYPAFSRILSGL